MLFLNILRNIYIFYYYNFDKYEKWKDIRKSLETEKNMDKLISKLFYYNEVYSIKNKFFNYIIKKAKTNKHFASKLLHSRFYIYLLNNLQDTYYIEKYVDLMQHIIYFDLNLINNIAEYYDIEYVLFRLSAHIKSNKILHYYVKVITIFSCLKPLTNIILENIIFLYEKRYNIIKHDNKILFVIFINIKNIMADLNDDKKILKLMPIIMKLFFNLYKYFKKHDYFLFIIDMIIRLLIFKTDNENYLINIVKFLVNNNFFRKIKKIKKNNSDINTLKVHLFYTFFGFNNFNDMNRLQIALNYNFYDTIYYYFVLKPHKINKMIYIDDKNIRLLNYVILLANNNINIDIDDMDKYLFRNQNKINKINNLYKNKIKKEFDKNIKKNYDENIIINIMSYIDCRDDIFTEYIN